MGHYRTQDTRLDKRKTVQIHALTGRSEPAWEMQYMARRLMHMARQKQVKTCKRCGSGGLYWGSFDGSWVLANVDGSRHVCEGLTQRVPRASKTASSPLDMPAVTMNQLEALLNEPEPVVETPSTNGKDLSAGGAALYSLIAPHLNIDLDSRVTAALAALDLSSFVPTVQPTPIVVTLADKQTVVATIKTPHKQTAKLVQYVSLGLHVMLIGPAGSGKTNAAEHVAEALGLKFYPQSVGAQTSKTDLLGYMDAHGKLVRTTLRDAYEHGGVFLLDEVDAGNANVLTVLNAALANGYCSFPDGVVKVHENFRCIAAGNTYGNGASRQYVGRNQLDAATLDRFTRMDWEYDEVLERSIAGDTAWTTYVHQLRTAQQQTGVKVILSTRAILKGTKLLAAGEPRESVEELVLWCGTSADDRAKLAGALRGAR